ncbi:MAG: translation initiation factor IF-2 [bacterium]
MSSRRRVFHIARELNISNEAVLSYLGKLDVSIRNQMSTVSDELYDEICKKYKKETVPVNATQEFRHQLKEKKILDELRRKKARMELEKRLRVATQLAEERPKKLKEIQEKAIKKKEEEKKLKRKKAVKPEIKAKEGLEKVEEEPSVVERISRAKKEIEKKKKLEAAQKEKEVKKPTKEISEEEARVQIEEKEEKVVEVPVEAEAEVEAPELKKAKEAESTKEEEKKAAEQVTAETTTKAPKDEVKPKKKKKKKRKISEAEIEESIRQTLAAMEEVKPKRHKRKAKESVEELVEEKKNVIKVSEFISAAELADLLNEDPNEIIKKCLELGMMVSINQRLDMDTIVAVADEFGYEVEIIEEYGSDFIEKITDLEIDENSAEPRSPVVTIMGHVDHGKTSLLDYIRKSNIIAGEAGGITQHIGAYEVSINGRAITFLDTPGHEAFTAMRARGAQVTDLVILIVAADDGVQPQTIEAIHHAKAAGVPIVVAINKIDKPNANPELVKNQLSENGILVESWGGKYQSVEISAKAGTGVGKLLEMILLEADILELKANPNRMARGTIIESKLDKGKGPIATVLVRNGTLKIGDFFIAGQFSGKVRAMYNERNRKVDSAPPSTPVQVVGFDGVPQAGDNFVVMETEKEIREISTKRQQLKREQDFRRTHHITLDQIAQQIRYGEVKELNLIVKADVDGSVEALSDALMKLSNEEVSVNVIHKAVGGISESDVLLASASQAIILGFQIRPTLQARELAVKEDVDIRLYRVIYDAVEDVTSALEGLLEPEITEEITSTIEVRQTFRIPKVGVVAGCYVLSGKVNRNDLAKVYREDRLIYETKIHSLKRFKDDIREVAPGFECGIGLEGFDDIKIGDVIETYKQVKTRRKL